MLAGKKKTQIARCSKHARAPTHLNGHDARDDGARDAHRAAALDVGQKGLGVVEKLSDDEVRPGIDLPIPPQCSAAHANDNDNDVTVAKTEQTEQREQTAREPTETGGVPR